MWELQNCLQMESGHYWWQLVNFVNISVRKSNCYNNDTHCAGSPPEGDGPSQRQILAVGREVQGDNGRAGESPEVIAFDLKGVETERDTLRKKVKETEIKIEVELALLSKSWSICSEGSEQEAERGADKGPACQGTGVCVGGGEINDLSSALTFSFSPPIFLRHILLIFCAHFLQTHSLLLLSGQGRLTLCSQLYLAVRKLTLC